jgi:hypothetical protein
MNAGEAMQELQQKAWEREDGTVGGATSPMEFLA